jgi:hypothetical protein
MPARYGYISRPRKKNTTHEGLWLAAAAGAVDGERFTRAARVCGGSIADRSAWRPQYQCFCHAWRHSSKGTRCVPSGTNSHTST